MNIRKAIAAWMTAATLTIGGAAFAEPLPDPETKAERAERESELYEDGQEAIDEGKWDRAISKFKSVAEMGGSRADGALYWTAYALTKSGRRSEALSTIDGLKKTYPKSKWIDDAAALEIEARQGLGRPVRPEGIKDDEMKIIAINSLMHTDPDKAYPLLEKIVRGTSSKKIKERALFILAQSPSPQAQSLIAEIARGNANPDLQRDAVKYIGIHGGKKNLGLLSELYASGTPEVKREVLQAFMISGQKDRVLSAAKTEKDTRLREKAIHLLGVMNAKAELHSMYATETSTEMKKEIIQALFISNDSQRIGELARTESDPRLRREAIRKLGLMGGTTSATLMQIYNAESSHEGKEAVIEALFLQNNARALIDLAKKETNQRLRKEALEKLSIMNDDEALQYMLQILEE